MEQLAPRTGSDTLERLIGADWPAGQRCWGVLDGVLTGSTWVDRWPDPHWVAVTELADGTTYFGGTPEPAEVTKVFARLAPASHEIVVGLRGDLDRIVAVLPPAPDYDGRAIDFSARRPDGDSGAPAVGLPPGARLAPMSVDLFRRSQWFADTVYAFGSIERWQELGLGVGVLVDEILVSEALAGPAIRETMEMGIVTQPDHRGRGYATAAASLLADECEARGNEVWWNANADNLPSLAVARRIGFSRERPYRVLMWRSERFRDDA